jgi:photosystem II stability/assembly factor-like uncharacterized protein
VPAALLIGFPSTIKSTAEAAQFVSGRGANVLAAEDAGKRMAHGN